MESRLSGRNIDLNQMLTLISFVEMCCWVKMKNIEAFVLCTGGDYALRATHVAVPNKTAPEPWLRRCCIF